MGHCDWRPGVESGIFFAAMTSPSLTSNRLTFDDEAALFDMVTINGTGHNMYMERPDAVSKAIVAFLDGEELPEAI